jgi:hypothetical protein
MGKRKIDPVRAIALYKSGKSMAAIGQELGVSPTSVHRILIRGGVERRTIAGRYLRLPQPDRVRVMSRFGVSQDLDLPISVQQDRMEMPFPLSDGTLLLLDLPRRLSSIDAKRLCGVLQTLIVPEDI